MRTLRNMRMGCPASEPVMMSSETGGSEAAESGSLQSAQEAIDWIVSFIRLTGIQPGLERMQRMMELLDHPERRLKFIHVAGTNGKGSVCAYLSGVLQECGYDVGTFTSPYIETYHERIRLNGVNISDEDLLKAANKIKPLAEQVGRTELGHPTMFELSTIIAIEYFARTAYPDFVVWETGLGGRLDSTNIVTPLVSVITNIGHDHMDMLGDSITQIAYEKAGIIKPGVPVVTSTELPEALDVLVEAAEARKSTIYRLGREFTYSSSSSQVNQQLFRFDGPFRAYEQLEIGMNGGHQLKNAAAAVMALEVLRQFYAVLVDEEELQRALKSVRWPGRLEMISESPRILIDGAHNPEGAEALASAIKDTYAAGKVHFLMGMLANKNHEAYFRHILPIVDTLIVTEPDWIKKMPAEELASIARGQLEALGRHAEVIVEPDWKQALQLAKSIAAPQDDLLVVSGTLYLIGDVRSWVCHQTDSEKGW